MTEAVYNRYAYDKEKREALTTWEAELAKLIRPSPRDATYHRGKNGLSTAHPD